MQKTSLTALARAELETASRATSGRGSKTVYGGHEHQLRQTVIALRAGRSLADHDNQGEATVQVLQGRVRLTTTTESWEGTAGDHVAIPPVRHGLAALDDSVILLTVVSPR